MADNKDLEILTVGDVREESIDHPAEQKSGTRLEKKAILEVINRASLR
jgi:hypothetical protein